jgi:hypothetical protein
MCKLSLSGLWALSLLGGLDLVSSAALRQSKHDEDIAILEGYLDIDSTSSSNSSSPDSFLVNMVRI